MAGNRKQALATNYRKGNKMKKMEMAQICAQALLNMKTLPLETNPHVKRLFKFQKSSLENLLPLAEKLLVNIMKTA